VLEIVPLVENIPMDLSEYRYGFTSPVRSLVCTSCNFTLGSTKTLLLDSVPSRIGNLVAIAQRGERFQPNIDPDRVIQNRKGFGFYNATEAGVPISVLTLNR
jgi:hypothetical protein